MRPVIFEVSRTVPITRSPRLSSWLVSSRPNPLLTPVMSQVRGRRGRMKVAMSEPSSITALGGPGRGYLVLTEYREVEEVLAWPAAELASVWESIASTTWSSGCLASMGIAPNARKRTE